MECGLNRFPRKGESERSKLVACYSNLFVTLRRGEGIPLQARVHNKAEELDVCSVYVY